MAAHSAYDMFSWHQYLIVDLVFLEWESFFFIAPFPDLCHFISLFSILVELSQMYPITINVIQASVSE